MTQEHECVVVGGGPAGLTTAYELSKSGKTSLVLEADDTVGGLSRTCEYKGYRFDVGGHRFFTKVDYVQELWLEMLGDEFLSRPRLSRIFYRGTLFDYPLKPLNALRGLGLVESVRVGLSYAKVMVFPHREERTFEQWVTNRFGKRLFEVFFKTYTEKVWGIPCSEISAEWAAQRIKNLDLVAAVKNAVLGGAAKKKGEVITTLIDEFQYPRHGPGQMWTACTKLLEERGSEVRLNAPVTRIVHADGRVRSVVTGDGTEVQGDEFFSSMPIQTLLRSFDPPPPPEVIDAANRLRYRDFLTVALIVDRDDLFPDNWIYIHSPDVQVGRIQNYKNWSPEMVPDSSKTALGLEYFVQEGDELWNADDDYLVELGRKEVDLLGLAPADAVQDGTVLRMQKAYPVYDDEYKGALEVIRGWLEGLPNLQLIGRNGQHRYNNQDHSMMTGVYAARNVLGADYDVWGVNVEQEYHEEKAGDGEKAGGGDRLVPGRVDDRDLAGLIRRAFGHYDARALGAAVGAVLGLGLFGATAILLLAAGDEEPGQTLSLLGKYFLGYSVSWTGAFLALAEGAIGGFVLGWLLAKAINILVESEKRRLMRQLERGRALSVLEGEQT